VETTGGGAGAQDESGEVEVETWDAIRSRRNVRSYAKRAIAPEDLDRILEAAWRLLGVPEDRFCALLVTLGVPAGRPLAPIKRPDRRPFNDVVHRGHW
jgi:nitroreductase